MCSNISWAVEQLRASKTCRQHPAQTMPVKDCEFRSLGADQKLRLREWFKPLKLKHPTKEGSLLSAPSSSSCSPRGAQAPPLGRPYHNPKPLGLAYAHSGIWNKPMGTCCMARGPRPNTLRESMWEKNLKKNGCVYMHNKVTLLYSRIITTL